MNFSVRNKRGKFVLVDGDTVQEQATNAIALAKEGERLNCFCANPEEMIKVLAGYGLKKLALGEGEYGAFIRINSNFTTHADDLAALPPKIS
jgi:hypothetical protein